jgi:hypothetical protein
MKNDFFHPLSGGNNWFGQKLLFQKSKNTRRISLTIRNVIVESQIQKTELNFQSYREGASGANGGKAGG